jgi:hypothetical protein
MEKCPLIYRIYDDHEEKHYVSSSLDHKKLEEIVDEYKKKNESVYAREFIKFLSNYDPEAHEVEVKDFYF